MAKRIPNDLSHITKKVTIIIFLIMLPVDIFSYQLHDRYIVLTTILTNNESTKQRNIEVKIDISYKK
jgi:hypothetical protein